LPQQVVGQPRAVGRRFTLHTSKAAMYNPAFRGQILSSALMSTAGCHAAVGDDRHVAAGPPSFWARWKTLPPVLPSSRMRRAPTLHLFLHDGVGLAQMSPPVVLRLTSG
jgi:hypothetical protein